MKKENLIKVIRALPMIILLILISWSLGAWSSYGFSDGKNVSVIYPLSISIALFVYYKFVIDSFILATEKWTKED